MSFITLNRKLFNHFLWTENRTFSKFEAWIDLIQLVSFKSNNQRLIKGVLIKWDRGQYPVSYSFLSQRWNWKVQKVRGYMMMLKSNKQINTQTTNVTTILTLCNYDQYNIKQQAEQQPEQQADGGGRQQADNKQTTISIIKKQDNKENKGKGEPKNSADFIDRVVGEFVKAHGNYEILNRGKERSAAGKLLGHYKLKYPDASTEETLSGMRKYFDACVNIEDNWLRENMSLSIIINKFNEINNILRNGKHKNSGATNEQLANLLADKLGVKE